MKNFLNPLRGLMSAAIVIAAFMPAAAAETTLCSFQDGTKTNITISGTTTEGSAKYELNKTSVTCLQLKNGYTTDDAWNGNAINLDAEGGFKAGDVVTVQGFINNSDEKKRATAVIVSLSADNQVTVINTFPDFINGRLVADTPAKMQFTLTEDYPNLKLVRDGGTGANLMFISVTRDEASIDEIVAESESRTGVWNLKGQRVAETLDGLAAGLYITNGKKVLVK